MGDVRTAGLRDALLLLTMATYSAGAATPVVVALVPLTLLEIATRRWQWISSPLDRPLLALALVSLVSGVISPWRATAFPSALALVVMVLVLLPAVLAYARQGSRRVVLLLNVWVAGGVGAALWILSELHPAHYPFLSTRTLTQNGVGLTMALASIVAVGLLLQAEGRARWLLAAAILLMGAALLLTMARAAWVGFVAGVATLLLVARPQGRRLLAGATAVALLASVALVPRWPFLYGQVRSIFMVRANRNRLDIWQAALRVTADYPLFGVGLGAFGRAYPAYRNPAALDETAPFAHNVFLNFLAETGFLGLAAFLVLCVAGLQAMGRWWSRSPPGERYLAGTVLATTVALLATQLFDTTVMLLHLGISLFVLLALGVAGEQWGYQRDRA